MKITICFMTARKEPRFDWLLEGLEAQRQPGDEFDILAVDFYERTRLEGPGFTPVIEDSVRVVPPKPTIWQGRHRVTKEHWWATANSRNTALVLANTDYLVCLDDRSHLGPEFIETVRRYEGERDAVLVGSYDKLEDGNLVSKDHRRELFPDGKRNCDTGWLYGCAFALPLAWALEVNGLEEGCDGLTGEDYIFGLMLSNAEKRIDFDPKMFVRQDRTTGNTSCKGIFKCMDKGVSPNDKSHAALARFGARSYTEFTPDLTKMRNARLADPAWTFPVPDPNGEYRDWFDGQAIKEM